MGEAINSQTRTDAGIHGIITTNGIDITQAHYEAGNIGIITTNGKFNSGEDGLYGIVLTNLQSRKEGIMFTNGIICTNGIIFTNGKEFTNGIQDLKSIMIPLSTDSIRSSSSFILPDFISPVSIQYTSKYIILNGQSIVPDRSPIPMYISARATGKSMRVTRSIMLSDQKKAEDWQQMAGA